MPGPGNKARATITCWELGKVTCTGGGIAYQLAGRASLTYSPRAASCGSEDLELGLQPGGSEAILSSRHKSTCFYSWQIGATRGKQEA